MLGACSEVKGCLSTRSRGMQPASKAYRMPLYQPFDQGRPPASPPHVREPPVAAGQTAAAPGRASWPRPPRTWSPCRTASATRTRRSLRCGPDAPCAPPRAGAMHAPAGTTRRRGQAQGGCTHLWAAADRGAHALCIWGGERAPGGWRPSAVAGACGSLLGPPPQRSCQCTRDRPRFPCNAPYCPPALSAHMCEV
jgi:hypothetical protein